MATNKATETQKRIRPFDAIMAQHIPLPGAPQLIVTRGFAYQWLKKTGHDESERGFGSMDYIVFAATETAEPLTDLALEPYATFLAAIEADLTAPEVPIETACQTALRGYLATEGK